MTTSPPTKPGRTLKLRPAKGWLRNPVTARASSELTARDDAPAS